MRTWPSGQPLRVALAGLLTTAQALPVGAAQAPSEPVGESPAESNQAEALRLFREAKALYTAGQPREAAVAFERSFAAAASPEAAYNAAQAHDKTDDPIATLMWFRRYLAIARQDTDPSYPVALARADELRARVAELRVELERPDEVREIHVNDEPVPLDSFPRIVLPGRARLRFTGASPDQVVELSSETRAGETATIYFPGFARPVVKPQPVARPVVRPPELKPSPHLRPLKVAFWTSAGVTGASAVLMAVFGGLALHELKLWKNGACVDGECPPDFVDHDTWMAHHTAAGRYAGSSNVMIGVTAGLAVISLGLGLAALRESRRPRAGTRAGQVVPGPGGLQVAF